MAKGKILPVAVVGAGMIKFGELFSVSFEDMIVEAYKRCIRSVDKGIDEEEIEAAWLGTAFGSLIRRESVTGASLAEPLGLLPKPVTRVENACASGSDAVRNAAFAVAAGIYDCVLVVGAEKMAGIGPKDVNVAEVHDCFTITELITYEDLGFCEKGEGGKFIEEGRSHLNGEVAVNSSGGLKSKGHPIGATGVAQIYELWEQFRQEAGERQVKNAQIGLTHNLGGSGSIVCVNIFGTEPR